MRLGGTAQLLAEPENGAAARDLIAFLQRGAIPFRAIGGGSNILPPDGESGLVVVGTRRFDSVDLSGSDPAILRAGAGAPLARLVSLAGKQGLTGLEGLAGIPGTVGGAAVMNAGGRHGSLEEVFEEAVVLEGGGGPTVKNRKQCGFRYRGSNLGGWFILEVALRLGRDRPESVRERTRAILEEKRRTQPLDQRSCGCIFKNPPGRSAGQLLDQAGLKGSSEGGALISPKHANFMVNTGGATRRDFDGLIDRARAKVLSIFSVELDLEVERW